VNSKEYVVRIVIPSSKPKPSEQKLVSLKLEKNIFQKILGGLGVSIIIALGTFLAISFFNLGIPWKDILILVGIPLALGIAASYMIL